MSGVLLAVVPLVAFASFEGVLPLGDAYRQVEVSRAAASRTFALVDAESVVTEPAYPLPAPAAGAIELEDVTFGYTPASAPVLNGLAFSMAPGDRLGLVGPSGAGKTTVVNLLLRFWEPDEGRILIDGADVRDHGADDVRALFGVVPQHPYLFNGTLRDNLLLADGHSEDADILGALDRAGFGAHLSTLPSGLDTRVGENGMQLSGGQRQQVAIARVILRNAPMLILDEATANLDARTERAVLAELDAFARDKTLLVLSHRPAALELVDRKIELAG